MTTEEFAKALLMLPESHRIVPWEEQKNRVVCYQGMLLSAHPDGEIVQFNGASWPVIGFSLGGNNV